MLRKTIDVMILAARSLVDLSVESFRHCSFMYCVSIIIAVAKLNVCLDDVSRMK